ncbi:MAG TPA: glycosyltransferase family 39 protein [Acetobacteraceae bacterium]|nr:glycosyltransferase family 39 protein [Acetobacteraceae bacterium]
MTVRRRGAALVGCLIALTALRLVAAAVVPLAPDETYYWVFSRALAPGYLDHPPMVALWVWAGTAIAGPSALGVRLLGPLSGLFGTLLLHDAANRIWPDRQAGAAAAAFLNATLLCGVGAVIMTPDTPLLLFWTACLWALVRLLDGGRPAWWLAIGLFAGLALASKYTALLLWPGIALWLLWVPSLRRWWRSPMPWAGASLGALVFLPVVAWNAQHDWVSFLRQGGRVDSWHPSRAVQFIAELIGGQLGLATPLLFPLFVAGLAWATRRAWRDRDPAASLLCTLTLPGAVVFLQHALGDRVQGNWPAILYPAAAIAAAGLPGRRWCRLRWPAVGLGAAMTLLVYIQAATFALPLPARADPLARQLAGWQGLAGAVDAVRRQQGAHCVASDEYGVASELARALPPDVMVLGVGPRWHLFSLESPALDTRPCIMVGRPSDVSPTGWREARSIGVAARTSDGALVQRFGLWRVAGALPSLSAAVLPAPAAVRQTR